MANKYTRFVPTEYVPQYQPINMGMVGDALANARTRREAAELSDVRQENAMRQLIGSATTDKGKEFAQAVFDTYSPSIQERQERGYSSRDLLRTQLGAEKAASSLETLQTAQEARSQWADDFMELNKDRINNPNELAHWQKRYAPEIEYDMDSLTASISGGSPTQLAEDVMLAEKTDSYLKGSKERGFVDGEGNQLVERVLNPETGEYEITTSSGIDNRRVLAILDRAFAADPEIQAYRGRKTAYFTDLAEQQGADVALEELKQNAPDSSLGELQEEIDSKRARGFSDAEIVGTLKADNEIRSAQGFGQSKYAFTEFDRKYRTPAEQETDRNGRYLATDLIQSEALNNPYVTSMPETFAAPALTISQSERLATIKEEARGIQQRGSKEGAGHQPTRSKEDIARLAEINEEINKMQTSIELFKDDTPLEEQAKSDQVRELYGDAINQIVQENPKRDQETEEAYKERISNLYQQKRNYLASQRGFLYDYSDETAREKAKSKVLGERNSNTPGSIVNSKIYPTGPEGDEEFLNFEQWVTKGLGMDLTQDVKEEILDNVAMIGEFRGNDPNIPSGVIVSTFINGERQLFKVADPRIREQQTFEPLRKISEFKADPRKISSSLGLTDSRTGRELDVEFIKEGQYIDGAYRGERIGFRVPSKQTITDDDKSVTFEEGQVIWENSPYYHQFLTGITGITGN